MENRSIQLTTYGSVIDRKNEQEMNFEVPEKWLVKKIELLFKCTLKEFLQDYTWDSSEIIFRFAESEGVIISSRFPNEISNHHCNVLT